jgi:transcription-repair coupling factor (superfamily II helicase)
MIPEELCAGPAIAPGALPPPRRTHRTEEIDAFGAELIDRFGPLPDEVEHLLKIVFIKALCRSANVEKLDAGPKGVVIQFRNASSPNPAGLVGYIGEQGTLAKIRPDQSVVFMRDWPTPEKRLAGSAVVMTQLARLVDAIACAPFFSSILRKEGCMPPSE